MIQHLKGPGTIRVALIALGFVVLTLALALLQPGPRQVSTEYVNDQQVSKSDANLFDLPKADAPVAPPKTADPAPDITVKATPTPMPQTVPQPRNQVGADDLRQLSWNVVKRLNSANGQNQAPGEPGSLLHTVVQRALSEESAKHPAQNVQLLSSAPDTYVVKPNDTLLVIAQRIYGDASRYKDIFNANTATLTDPESVIPGQVLVIPAK